MEERLWNDDFGKNEFLYDPAHTGYTIYSQGGRLLKQARNFRNFFRNRGSINGKWTKAMKCEEMLAILGEYVDGTIDPAICEEFERHLAGCNPCQVVVDNIHKTITLYKEGKPYELPVEFRQQLHDMLQQRWKEKHPTGGRTIAL